MKGLPPSSKPKSQVERDSGDAGAMELSRGRKKVLVLRLSSLGDVILATAALEIPRQAGGRWDWVVSTQYVQLLEGHPGVGRVWGFDRRSGLLGWVRLARELFEQDYDEVLDLHRTLRSRVLYVLFMVWTWMKPGRKGRRSVSGGEGRTHRRKLLCWRTVSKQRWRLYGYFCLKGAWPVSLRPRPVVERMARCAGGTGIERPDLRHLVSGAGSGEMGTEAAPRISKPYVCVMPGSLWRGKCWPVERFFEVAKTLASEGRVPVILGAASDAESRALEEMLVQAGITHHSGVGKWSLRQVAGVLAGAEAYVGNDTGLAHLCEAVGGRSVVVFGPTTPEMGFGPWRGQSRSLGASLWCRPCGKDGRYCLRLGDRFRCLRDLSAGTVKMSLGAGSE